MNLVNSKRLIFLDKMEQRKAARARAFKIGTLAAAVGCLVWFVFHTAGIL